MWVIGSWLIKIALIMSLLLEMGYLFTIFISDLNV